MHTNDQGMTAGRDARHRYDVFLSSTRRNPTGPSEIKNALEHRGLTVFRDDRIEEFDGITDGIAEALAGSAVLLAYYSKEFPEQYACQWELTAAFLAGQREGDPLRRVLVVNPDAPQCDHIAPVELSDARFFGPISTTDDLDRLAALVRTKVDATVGPIGTLRSGTLLRTVDRKFGFTGRYPQMWAVHSHLHAPDFPMVHEPVSQGVAVVRGLPGMGKSSLVQQYAHLFQDAYPSGVVQTGPFDDARRESDPSQVLAQFNKELQEFARHRLGMRFGSISLTDLRLRVADQLTRAGDKLLVIVDDLPGSIDEEAFGQLLIPSPLVRTVITTRTGAWSWHPPTVVLGGLTVDEANNVLQARRPAGHGLNRVLVTELVDRCGGHPQILQSIARQMRNHRGVPTAEAINGYFARAGQSVTEAMSADIALVSPEARRVLDIAAVLAPAPFPPSVVAGALSWSMAETVVAFDELGDNGLARHSDQGWEVHAVVSDAVLKDNALPALAVEAARTLLDLPDRDVHFVRHALTLANRNAVPVQLRLRLLRTVASEYRAQGDTHAAGAIHDRIVELGVPTANDLIDAAEAWIGCGRYQDAVAAATRAIGQTSDEQLAYRGRLIGAQALDCQWRFVDADALFWATAEIPAPWSSAEQRFRTLLARAVAHRLRGEPKAGLEVLDPIRIELRAAPPGPIRDEVAPSVQLEYARLLQLTGRAREARTVADEVVAYYRNAGLETHSGHFEALGVKAEASLTLDLTELKAKPELWQWSQQQLAALLETHVRYFGGSNPLTLAAAVRADRALISLGKPEQALRAMATTEQDIVRHLGERDPLRQRLRFAMAQAHGQLREFSRESEILRDVLALQEATIGEHHPDTVETRLELGIALAMIGCRAEAIELVDRARHQIKKVLGSVVELNGKATAATCIVRLPSFAIRRLLKIEGFLGGRTS